MRVISKMSDRIIVMEKGKIIKEETPENVINKEI